MSDANNSVYHGWSEIWPHAKIISSVFYTWKQEFANTIFSARITSGLNDPV